MKILFVSFFVVSTLFSNLLEFRFGDKKREGMIEILDVKHLDFKRFEENEFLELSDLAYKDGTLYILSDKGVLFSFDADINNDQIQRLQFLKTNKLRDKKGKELKVSKSDAEGLSFLGNELLISFERKHRVELFSIDGQKLKKLVIHKELQDKKAYRKKNKGLEAVVYSKTYGVLTLPELSLNIYPRKTHLLYSKDHTWEFPASGNVSSIEMLDEHSVLVLEKQANFFSRRWIITLSSLNLINSQHKILAEFDTRDGWNLDNFEGLSKVGENSYLMISDDNDSFFQKTLLVLFRVVKD